MNIAAFRLSRRLGLGLAVLLFFGTWWPIQNGRAEETTGWKETPLSFNSPGGATSVCFDGSGPGRLFVAGPENRSGTFAYNLATGEKTLLNSREFYLCNETTGLLYAYKDGSARSAVRFSAADPQGEEIEHGPTHVAADGTLQVYSLQSDSQSLEYHLYASADGGLNWEEHGQQFGGKVQSLVVAEADARVIYVTTQEPAPGGKKYSLYASNDAGLNWEKRYEQSGPSGLFGPTLYLTALPGHTAPVGTLLLNNSSGAGSNGVRISLVSTDGGHTFTEVGTNGRDSGVLLYYSNAGLVRFSRNGTVYSLALSTDGAKTWEQLSLPYRLPDSDIGLGINYPILQQVANAPSNFLLYNLKGDGDLWYTPDSGRTWQKLGPNMALMKASPYAPLTLAGIKDNRVYTYDLSGADKSHTAGVAASGGPDSNFYPDTGHNLAGRFKAFWEQNGGLAQFGFPRTEPFRELNPSDGKVYTVQYFERNRFEYHPDNAGTRYEVLLGLLGNQLTETRRAAGEGPFSRSPDLHYPGGTYFPDTGHNLRASFKKYWDANGGLAIYGFPVSEEFEEVNPDDGRTYLVQYFERNRFEYHPDNAGTRYEVLLGLLGNTLLKQKGWNI